MAKTVKTSTLYRPLGQAELELSKASGARRFPPRLYFQPTFYPVLTEEYSIRIARDWNTKDGPSEFVGYVLRFEADTAYLDQLDVQEVGGRELRKYLIPAERLEESDDHIVGPTLTTHEFRPPAIGAGSDV